MDVAYTTEKSIQDELERSSKAETITVVASYALMFLYVAFALSEVKCSVKEYFVSPSYSLNVALNYFICRFILNQLKSV